MVRSKRRTSQQASYPLSAALQAFESLRAAQTMKILIDPRA
jgi:hypothetical protein